MKEGDAMEPNAEIICTRCGLMGDHRQEPGTGPHHAKLVCGGCGVFLTWLKKPRKNKAALPPTDDQLLFLRSLGYAGEVPATRREASLHINARLEEKRTEDENMEREKENIEREYYPERFRV